MVLVGMLNIFLSPSSGFINSLIKALGMEPIYFFGEAGWFRHVYVLSDVWQNAGWGSIIYMAALTAVSPELHEAAKMCIRDRPLIVFHDVKLKFDG